MIEARNASLRVSLCLLLAVAACSSSDDGTGPDENSQGTFTATLSGPVNTSLSGYAWQSGTIVDQQSNQQGWVLFLGTNANASAVYIIRQGSRPGPGTYSMVDLNQTGDLSDGQFGGIATVSLGGTQTFAGFTSGGTITISSSSEERVQGTFNLQFTGFDPNTQLEVTATASGSFNAVANAVVFPGF